MRTTLEEAGGGFEFGQGDAEGGDRKKRAGLVEQRADANWLRVEYAASEHRVCGLMGMAVSSYRYQRKHKHLSRYLSGETSQKADFWKVGENSFVRCRSLIGL